MEPASNSEIAIQRHGKAPARMIKLILQMALGAGIAVTLLVKIYMLVLTDLVCVQDSMSLGNLIRCNSALRISGGGLALAAGFELAYLLFTVSLVASTRPLILGLSSAMMFVLSGVDANNVNWQTALVIASLTASLCALLWWTAWFSERKPVQVATQSGTERH